MTSSRVRRQSVPITALITRPRRTGRRLRWGSPAAAALTMLSRSAVPRRLPASFGAIRVGGKISMIGGLSGPATELNPGLIFARRANVQGISVGSMQMFEAMSRAIAASGIKPVLDKVFPFDEAQAAYRHMASGAHFGKIVIRVA